MSGGRAVRSLGAVAMAGATLQLVYVVLAVVWPYPQIIASGPELLRGLVNLGMVAGIVAWLAIDVARSRWLALIGGGVAILGHLLRLGGVDLDDRPTERQPRHCQHHDRGLHCFDVRRHGSTDDWHRRGRRLSGLGRWAPGLVLATGMITAAFYSTEKVAHFALLGLLWGAAWMLLAYLARRQAIEPIIWASHVATLSSPPITARRP